MAPTTSTGSSRSRPARKVSNPSESESAHCRSSSRTTSWLARAEAASAAATSSNSRNELWPGGAVTLVVDGSSSWSRPNPRRDRPPRPLGAPAARARRPAPPRPRGPGPRRPAPRPPSPPRRAPRAGSSCRSRARPRGSRSGRCGRPRRAPHGAVRARCGDRRGSRGWGRDGSPADDGACGGGDAGGEPGPRSRDGSWARIAASSSRSGRPGSTPSSSTSVRRASSRARSASAWRPLR
jgi:hypothetical protein